MSTLGYFELGSYTGSIKKLHSSSGWTVWIREITSVIKICGFGDLLRKNKEKPTRRAGEPERDIEARIHLWESRQEQILEFVLSHLSFQARIRVEKTKTLCLTIEALKQDFAPGLHELYHKYATLTLDGCMNVADYAEKLWTARMDFEQLDDTCFIGEPFFINKFLTGLGSSYEYFITVFCEINSLLPERHGDKIIKAAVTFEEAVIAAKEEEHSQAQRRYDLDPAATGPRIICSHCRKTGHQREKCWNLHPELMPEGLGRRKRKRVAIA